MQLASVRDEDLLTLLNNNNVHDSKCIPCEFSFIFFFRHLDGAVLESLGRPHLLITDSYNAMNAQARRKERDQMLLSTYVRWWEVAILLNH